MSGFERLKELTRVRVLSFWREPEAVFWVIVFPLVLAAVLGFAFRSGGVVPTKVAVIDGPGVEELVEAFQADEYLEVERYATRDEAFVKLRKAAVDGMIEPADPPRMTFDPNRPEAATAELRVLRALRLAAGEPDPVMEKQPVTEKGARYVDYLFPGLLGMNVMGTSIWGIGFAIADFRRRKFIKRLLVTPMRKPSFFLAFMLSRLVFLVVEVVVLTTFGAWVLGVPFRCDPISFGVISLVGALTFAGIGILIASRARTIEGASGLMNLVMVPMWLLSGIFFSYERFPELLHPVIRLLPLTALNDALRASMIDGASVLSLGQELGVMIAWCALTFVISLKIFRWE